MKDPGGITPDWRSRDALLIPLLVAVVAMTMLAMGRVPFCVCGSVKLWHGDIFSAENSQHLTDWHTATHVLHGMLFYAGLWLSARWRGMRLPLGTALVLAVAAESGWEILENTPFIINRYRETTLALGYEGDSIVNAIFDIVAMIAGFMLARFMPVAVTLAIGAAIELVLALAIRDNLILNLLMLLMPIEAIEAWQMNA
jgi:hypothetical protein